MAFRAIASRQIRRGRLVASPNSVLAEGWALRLLGSK